MDDEVEMSGWMRWFPASEGGRGTPHPGGRHAATAAAASGPVDDPWSITFDDVPAGPGIGLGEGAVYARRLNGAAAPVGWGRGTRLVITEGPRPVADVEILATAVRVERPWTFRVTQSFWIGGRGVGVFGDLTGEIDRSGRPAELQSRGQLLAVPQAWLEFARIPGGERIALLLRGVEKDHVVPGSLLRGCAL
ncbi:hypothetical protein [Streptomyces sp. NPDC049040]|uniref:hypothetical protein n=1 Tax=Streptomyces sp. NPDC049040 TaxID=3365593 RepID=UPI003711485E